MTRHAETDETQSDPKPDTEPDAKPDEGTGSESSDATTGT